jgi:hypothetical protein
MIVKPVCVQFFLGALGFLPLFHEEVLPMKLKLTSDMYTFVLYYTILYYVLYGTVVLNGTRFYLRYYQNNRRKEK